MTSLLRIARNAVRRFCASSPARISSREGLGGGADVVEVGGQRLGRLYVEQLAGLSEQTSQQLGQGLGWLPVAGALGVLAGVVAALCSWWGVSLRLEEYR